MERVHIAFFGPVNSGKSTLVNALCGQEVSLVSPLPGTTTDPVRKAVEIPGLGPCLIIDTPGLEDDSALGAERERRTRAVLDEADIAVVVLPPSRTGEYGAAYMTLFEEASIPVVTYSRGETLETFVQKLSAAVPSKEETFLTGNLVHAGSRVLLVMPQDSEAPKGRLIVPQMQVIRELLDRGCVPVCCTPESLRAAMDALSAAPDLVITDSQVFGLVNRTIPAQWPLTSFSILLAGNKGDLHAYFEGARAIDSLGPSDRVLIAEACTHVPDSEDIGRVKIPALLRKRAGEGLQVDISAGNDFPENLRPYNLIIHCGACVAGRALVQSRIKKALREGVPITNYGIALAKLQGILDRVIYPSVPGNTTNRRNPQ